MAQIQYPLSPIPGVPLENSFQIVDEFGMKSGSASVIEFINQTMLPDRPLNYYLSISAQDSRSLHLLVGAAYTRTLELRRKTDGSVWAQLLGIAFFGGFLFQLVWETKSRYCFPFFVFLLPLAALGFTAALRRAGERLAK